MAAKEMSHERRLKAITDLAQTLGRPVQWVPKMKLDMMAERETPHQGIIASVAPKALLDIYDLVERVKNNEKPSLVIALDGVTDPHNFGAILRVAAAVDATAVMVPKVGSSPFSPAVSKASAGTVELVDVCMVINMTDALKRLKDAGLWWVAAAGTENATLYTDYDFTGSVGVVLGSEGDGIRRLVQETCDTVVAIPLAAGVESLNVSVAAAVLLFEAQRQRALKL